ASGLPHGAYLGIGAVVAASLVPVGRRGRAMSRVMLGLTIANIFGVPFAAALGNLFGWRSAYALVAGLGVLTVIMVAVGVPRVSVGAGEVPSARGEIKALGRARIILTLLAGSVGFGGMFAVYTYITPTMTEIASVPSVAIPWVLAVYGLGMTAGSLIAGPLVDKSIERSATGGMILSALVLAAFGAFTHIAAIAIIALFLIGVSGSMITTALQMRLFRESQDAPSLSAAMNHAAVNLANAIGAWLGGIVITAGLGRRRTVPGRAHRHLRRDLAAPRRLPQSQPPLGRREPSLQLPRSRRWVAAAANNGSASEASAATTPERRDHCARAVVSTLHRCLDTPPGPAQWSRRSTGVSALHSGLDEAAFKRWSSSDAFGPREHPNTTSSRLTIR